MGLHGNGTSSNNKATKKIKRRFDVHSKHNTHVQCIALFVCTCPVHCYCVVGMASLFDRHTTILSNWPTSHPGQYDNLTSREVKKLEWWGNTVHGKTVASRHFAFVTDTATVRLSVLESWLDLYKKKYVKYIVVQKEQGPNGMYWRGCFGAHTARTVSTMSRLLQEVFPTAHTFFICSTDVVEFCYGLIPLRAKGNPHVFGRLPTPIHGAVDLLFVDGDKDSSEDDASSEDEEMASAGQNESKESKGPASAMVAPDLAPQALLRPVLDASCTPPACKDEAMASDCPQEDAACTATVASTDAVPNSSTPVSMLPPPLPAAGDSPTHQESPPPSPPSPPSPAPKPAPSLKLMTTSPQQQSGDSTASSNVSSDGSVSDTNGILSLEKFMFHGGKGKGKGKRSLAALSGSKKVPFSPVERGTKRQRTSRWGEPVQHKPKAKPGTKVVDAPVVPVPDASRLQVLSKSCRMLRLFAPIRWPYERLLDLEKQVDANTQVGSEFTAPVVLVQASALGKEHGRTRGLVAFPRLVTEHFVDLELREQDWGRYLVPKRSQVAESRDIVGVSVNTSNHRPTNTSAASQGTAVSWRGRGSGARHALSGIGDRRDNGHGPRRNTQFSHKVIYRGIRMASKLEARHCVFLDKFGIKWKYETPESAINYHGYRYRPDLDLNRMYVVTDNGSGMRGTYRVIIEIKPKREPGMREIDKCRECSAQLAVRAKESGEKPPIVVLFYGELICSLRQNNKDRRFVGSHGLVGEAFYNGQPLAGNAYWSIGYNSRQGMNELQLYIGTPNPSTTQLVHPQLRRALEQARRYNNLQYWA